MRTGAALLVLAILLAPFSAAENQEKSQKKALQAEAKAAMAEAAKLEHAGQLAEARAKYAESQALMETGEASDALKRLDEEIRNRAKDRLNEARRLYENHKFTEAVAVLEGIMKLGMLQPVLVYNIALCYYELGDRAQGLEFLLKARAASPDPKQRQRLSQLMTFFATGENGLVGESDRERVTRTNRLAAGIGVEASLEDEGEADDSDTAPPSPQVMRVSQATAAPPNTHARATHRSSLCTELEALKPLLAASASATYDRANCAESNGRLAEASQLLTRYLEMAPNALDAKQVQVRLAELQSLLALPAPAGPEVRRLYSSAYTDLAERNYDRALAGFIKSAELTPDFALNQWKLGLLYEAMADVQKARDHYTRYQQLTQDEAAKSEADLHLKTLDAKREKYDDEVDEAEEVLSELFNRGLNLTFNGDEKRTAIRARRAQIKKKQERKVNQNRVGGFEVPYAYAQQQLGLASGHLQVALALFPLGVEANELMALVFLQANDGTSAIRSFDAVASQGLPVSFYGEMRGRKLDHGVKCELTRDHIRLIFLSSYDKKGMPIAPDVQAGDDGLGDITLAPADQRQAKFDALEFPVSQVKRLQTVSGLIAIKIDKLEFTLAPIYLPSFTPVQGPQARRFANNYTRLFIRYPGLEDSKLGTEGMSGGEKFALGMKIADSGFSMATNGFTGIGAIQSVQDAISIARTIHAAITSLSVSFASWERNVEDEQELLAGDTFKAIPTQAANLGFVQEWK